MDLQKLTCERCGVTWETDARFAPETLCSACFTQNLVASLDEQKLDAIRQHVREGGMVRAVSAIMEVRSQLNITGLGQAVDLANFIRQQEKL